MEDFHETPSGRQIFANTLVNDEAQFAQGYKWTVCWVFVRNWHIITDVSEERTASTFRVIHFYKYTIFFDFSSPNITLQRSSSLLTSRYGVIEVSVTIYLSTPQNSLFISTTVTASNVVRLMKLKKNTTCKWSLLRTQRSRLQSFPLFFICGSHDFNPDMTVKEKWKSSCIHERSSWNGVWLQL